MARIAGVDLPREKQIQVSLTYLYGIGPTTARKLCAAAQIDPTRRTKDLTDDEVHRIRETLEQGYKVEGDLRRETSLNIKRLMDLGCYRGLRHRKGLPVRGQRTHTTARTRKSRDSCVVARATAVRSYDPGPEEGERPAAARLCGAPLGCEHRRRAD